MKSIECPSWQCELVLAVELMQAQEGSRLQR